MVSSPTIIAGGKFTSDGLAKVLNLRQDVDMLIVENYNNFSGNGDAATKGFMFKWQRGMTDGTGLKYYKTNGGATVEIAQLAAPYGFYLVDSSSDPLGVVQAVGGANGITAVSNAAIPVATNDGANGLIAGDVVRIMSCTGAPQLNGLDFTVGNSTLSGTTFSLDYMSQLAVAGTTAAWAKVNYQDMYYPRNRFITKVTKASSAVVTLSVTHGYTRGQKVIFSVPSAYGMSELDGLVGTITAVTTQAADGTNTVTVDIDSSAFTAFAFPAAAAVPFSPAVMSPYGENTAYARANSLDDTADAVYNSGYIGIKLGVGTNAGAGAAGASGDVMYWTAYKFFSVDNS
jgi:hypothetical protein